MRHPPYSGVAAICRVELERTAREFPLAFLALPGGRARLVALLGLPGRSLFASLDGRGCDNYVPASVRLQPFGWEQRASGDVVLCIDAASPLLATDRGLPLFDDEGVPTEVVRRATELVGHLVRDLARTERAATALLRAGVLEPWVPPLPGFATVVGEALRVSEARLRSLGAEALQALMAMDALMLAHAQLLSRDLVANLCGVPEKQSSDDDAGLGSLEFKF